MNHRFLQVPLTDADTYVLGSDVSEVHAVAFPMEWIPDSADDRAYTYSLLFGKWRAPDAAPLPYLDLVNRLRYLQSSGPLFESGRFDFDQGARRLKIESRPFGAKVMLVAVG
jgi:hypothetical protein